MRLPIVALLLGAGAWAKSADTPPEGLCLDSVPARPVDAAPRPSDQQQAAFQEGAFPAGLVPTKYAKKGTIPSTGAYYDAQGVVYRQADVHWLLAHHAASSHAYRSWLEVHHSTLAEHWPSGALTTIGGSIRAKKAKREALDGMFGRVVCAYNNWYEGRAKREARPEAETAPVEAVRFTGVRPTPEASGDGLPLADEPGFLDGMLDNGLRVTVVADPGLTAAAVVTRVGVGAAHENEEELGLAHLVEHLAFRGTESRDPGFYQDAMIRWGGLHNAFTGPDATRYDALVRARHLGELLELEADRLAHLALEPRDLELEREVIVRELGYRADTGPIARSAADLRRGLMPAHPYGRPLGGSPDSLAELELAQVLAFRDRWYRPEHIHLVVVGPHDAWSAWHRVEALLGTLEPGAAAAVVVPAVLDIPALDEDVVIQDPLVMGKRLALAFPLPPERACDEAGAGDGSPCTEQADAEELLLRMLARHGGGVATHAIFEHAAEEEEHLDLDAMADAELEAPDWSVDIGAIGGIAGRWLIVMLETGEDTPNELAREALRRGVDALRTGAWLDEAMLTAEKRRWVMELLELRWSPLTRAVAIADGAARGQVDPMERLVGIKSVEAEPLRGTLERWIPERGGTHVVFEW